MVALTSHNNILVKFIQETYSFKPWTPIEQCKIKQSMLWNATSNYRVVTTLQLCFSVGPELGSKCWCLQLAKFNVCLKFTEVANKTYYSHFFNLSDFISAFKRTEKRHQALFRLMKVTMSIRNEGSLFGRMLPPTWQLLHSSFTICDLFTAAWLESPSHCPMTFLCEPWPF